MKTPLQAAQEIAALINSRPRSPRVEELEAIISGVSDGSRHDGGDQTLAALRQRLEAVTHLEALAKR